MGIENLNKLIRKECPQAMGTTPTAYFRGKRLAIDGHGWAYTNWSIAQKKIINKTDVGCEAPNQGLIVREWFRMALDFICGWMGDGVTPVFVFDGDHPIEKTGTREKRREVTRRNREKADALEEEMKTHDALSRTPEMVTELRKVLCQLNYLPKENLEWFKSVLRGIGVPVLQAKWEGEQLCAMLGREGKVAGVFSADTDNLVYGAPLIIPGMADAVYDQTSGARTRMCHYVRVDAVLAGLQIEYKTFIDLCIMAGCDYNTNIPDVGIITALKLLRTHGSIDKLPEKYNVECLKHERCRSLFQHVESSSIITPFPDEPVPSLNVNLARLTGSGRDLLETVGASAYMGRLLEKYRGLGTPQELEVKSLIPLSGLKLVIKPTPVTGTS